jgi:hypothetical protein
MHPGWALPFYIPSIRPARGRRVKGVNSEGPRQGRKHGTVSAIWPRAGHLSAQDRDLVPEHEDLRVLSGVAAR